MIMKKLKLKVKNASLKVKAFEFYTTGLFFSFCIFYLLASDGYAQNSSKQLSTKVSKKQGHLLIARSPTTDLGRQLWQARISNPKDRDLSKSKNELYQIIEKIRSVKFEPQDKSAEPLIVVEPAPKTEPDESSSDSNVPHESELKKTEAGMESQFSSKRQDEKQLLTRQITDQTLKIFVQLSLQPQQLKNPIELAEILFCNGSLKEAAKCYREALNRITANEDLLKEKAWILFQIGNCLRNTDQPAAIEMYRQLIAEYSDSPWADLAKARSRLINWYQQDKPRELVAENRF
jgi:tetratricopeptide (TPR) repeat protein